jgi:hypothetical protein
MMEVLARPLTVVAHDAGAANHIFAWLGCEKPTLCLGGPALALWQTHLQKTGVGSGLSPFSESGLTAALAGAATVITGTGWESTLEHDARKLAREQGVRTIAVIDHWTNYADRFVRNGEQVLPDEIWVSDPYAAEIAQTVFTNITVVQQTNSYLAGLVTEVESRQPTAVAQGNDCVLYVLEPIRNMWGELDEPGEFLALDYFMENRHRASIATDAEIRLRPHPSDPPGKYNGWLACQDYPRVALDRSPSLADALAWSNVVAGCQTYAMVLALACGRTVISTNPAWARPCALPHHNIIHLSRINI